jgi:hypothetical protein
MVRIMSLVPIAITDPQCLVWRRYSANLVLEAAMERIYHGLQWAQIPRGLFLVRGENVVLLGEVVSSDLCAVLSHRIPIRMLFRILISKTRCHYGKHHGKRYTERFRQTRYVQCQDFNLYEIHPHHNLSRTRRRKLSRSRTASCTNSASQWKGRRATHTKHNPSMARPSSQIILFTSSVDFRH